jgi:integrase/recombinase XerD
LEVEGLSLIDDYQADLELRGLTPAHIKIASSVIQRYLAFLDGTAPAAVTQADLKRYLTVLKRRDIKYASLRQYFNHISSFYDFLVEEGMAQANPIPRFRKRYVAIYKEESPRRRVLTVEEAALLVSSILDSRNKAIVLLLLKTGLRLNELLALDVGDVALQAGEIVLKPAKKRSNRVVFFDEETRVILARWLKIRETWGPLSPALFISYKRTRLGWRSVEGLFLEEAARLGLHDISKKEGRVVPHSMRHCYTTWLRRAGMPDRILNFLRGDAISNPIGIYDHVDEDEAKKSYLAHIPQLGL